MGSFGLLGAVYGVLCFSEGGEFVGRLGRWPLEGMCIAAQWQHAIVASKCLHRCGVVGVTAPQEYGGLGMGYSEHCVAMEVRPRCSQRQIQ